MAMRGSVRTVCHSVIAVWLLEHGHGPQCTNISELLITVAVRFGPAQIIPGSVDLNLFNLEDTI